MNLNLFNYNIAKSQNAVKILAEKLIQNVAGNLKGARRGFVSKNPVGNFEQEVLLKRAEQIPAGNFGSCKLLSCRRIIEFFYEVPERIPAGVLQKTFNSCENSHEKSCSKFCELDLHSFSQGFLH